MVVTKIKKAATSYGRGRDNYRSPAQYAVVDASGTRVGLIMGSSAGYMERSNWEVCWLSPTGIPRVVHYGRSFEEAKEWARQWDGKSGVRPEWLASSVNQ